VKLSLVDTDKSEYPASRLGAVDTPSRADLDVDQGDVGRAIVTLSPAHSILCPSMPR
jgi:hypothetical protein